MKRTILYHRLAILLGLLLVFGCITAKKDPYEAELEKRAAEKIVYDQYETRHTFEGYQKFIQEYPDSIYVHSAQGNIDDLLFAPYLKKNTIDGYLEFIKTYPKNGNVDAAKRKIETLAFDECEQKDTIQGYQQYLQTYPESLYECEAKARIHELEFRKLDRELKELMGLDLLLYRLYLKRLQKTLYAEGKGEVADFECSAALIHTDRGPCFVTRLLYRLEKTPADIQKGPLTQIFVDALVEKAVAFLHRHVKKKHKIHAIVFEVAAAPYKFCKPCTSIVQYRLSIQDVSRWATGGMAEDEIRRKLMPPTP